MDVLVLAALTPCRFVSKIEVKRWPILGWFARLAGTIFVDRQRRTEALRSVAEIEAALQTGGLVVIFPEGTSSGGETILPFKSSLLEPAVRNGHSTSAGLLAYELEDGNPSEEVCYWKDMTLVPHLINLLSKKQIRVSVRIAKVRNGTTNRKDLAGNLRTQLLNLRSLSVA